MPTYPHSDDSTIIAHLRRMNATCAERKIIRCTGKQAQNAYTWAELLGLAAAAARWLGENGAEAGAVVPIMRHTGIDLAADFLGAVMLGARPCVLAPPNPKMSHEVFLRKLTGMVSRADLRVCVTDEHVAAYIREHVAGSGEDFRVLERGALTPEPPDGHLTRSPDADEPAFLQHSSGTSGVPKGVVISHRMLFDQLRCYGSAIGASESDRIVSWLPLYHDMGMVACFLGGLLWNIPASHMSNFEWVFDPAILLDEAAERRATLVWLPNFAFSFLARHVSASRLQGLDLSSVRMWCNCSEPVLRPSFEAFYERFAAKGVERKTLTACYAMAENVFAVSSTGGECFPASVFVDREALDSGDVMEAVDPANGRELMSSGRVIAGTEVAVAKAGGAVTTGENAVGELLVRGNCRLREYHRNPEATERALRGGWYHTGDLGFLRKGEVYVIGRKDDMLIVGGRNLDPTEIEHLAQGDPRVCAGRACCLGVENTEAGTREIHLIVETREPEAERNALAARLKALAQRETGFQVRQVWCMEPGWLIKSSSGKIARKENREKLRSLLPFVP